MWWVFISNMLNSCGSVRNERWEKDERRQSMTTWGLVALTVFISLGMAEWSKRTAASETVIDPMVMKEAIKIAAARDSGVKGFRKEGNSDFGGGSRVAGDELPATSNPKPATLRSENVATMQTSTGE